MFDNSINNVCEDIDIENLINENLILQEELFMA